MSLQYDGSQFRKYIILNDRPIGEIKAITGEDNAIIGYNVIDIAKNRTVSSNCATMNQAKAFAEYYFGKEVQS